MSETRRERDDAHAESAVRCACGAWCGLGGDAHDGFLLFRNQLSSLSLTRIIPVSYTHLTLPTILRV